MGKAYYNEIDPFAAQWLRNLIEAKLIAPGDVDERSIEDVRPDDVRGYTQCHFFAGIGGWSYALRLAGWTDNDPVWTGSCPCQPFSTNGKGLAEADSRHLWPVFSRLIAKCDPSTVFGEQVASPAGEKWLARVCSDLEEENYAVGCANLCAAGVGSPQERQRLFWVADGRTPYSINWVYKENGAQRDEWNMEDGPWADVKWFTARDERKFRCKPDIPLLDYGVSHRVGYLRGFGNSIVPQVAAEFITAYKEVR